jgi:DNA-binding NarL/FixJ family response regulator
VLEPGSGCRRCGSVVDDHPVVRDGLRGMFTGTPEFEMVGEATNGVEALAMAESLSPDVILMDLRMPGGDEPAAHTAAGAPQ